MMTRAIVRTTYGLLFVTVFLGYTAAVMQIVGAGA